MDKGWIKLHRSLLNWEWYSDKNTLCLFLHLLLRCNHKKKQWKGQTINPGEIIIGVETFGKEIGLSRQQTRSSLNRLKSTNEITIKTTPNFTLLKVNKWNEYQLDNQLANHRATKLQPSSNHQITTTKECNNEKNDKKTKTKVLVSKAQPIHLEDQLREWAHETYDGPVAEELTAFVDYWNQPSTTNSKLKWQLQDAFGLKSRLSTWLNRSNNVHRLTPAYYKQQMISLGVLKFHNKYSSELCDKYSKHATKG